MSEHNPEPWEIRLGFESNDIADANGKMLLNSHHELWSAAGRIVACINACKGIPTAALEAGIIHKAVFEPLLEVCNADCKPHRGVIGHPRDFRSQICAVARTLKNAGGSWEEYS